MRIRTIKPEFWTSEQIAECSPNARLLFIGMWNFCDDNGVHPASIRRLKMEVYPSDSFADHDVQTMVDELITAELLRQYTVDDKSYWMVTGWHKHQRIDRPTHRHPLPHDFANLPKSTSLRCELVEDSMSIRRTFDEHSTNNRRTIDEHPTSPRPRNGMESNGMESETGNKPDFDDATAASSKGQLIKNTGSSQRASRLPADWTPNEEAIAFCHAHRPDLDPDYTATRFKDYWIAQPDANGRKTDWMATWRNWVRNEKPPVNAPRRRELAL